MEILTSIEKRVDERNEDNIELRNYQQQLFEKAINRNLIISLPTGTGKTLIAINLIKYNLHQTDGTYPDVARRSVFIAPTRVLVDQQYDEICSLLKSTSVGKFHGELNVCGYNKKAWSQHWNNYRVLLFTPAVLYNCLKRGYLHFHNINVFIFDEGHHCNGNHPYRKLINLYKTTFHRSSPNRRPRFLILTASIINKKVTVAEMDEKCTEVEKLYDAKIKSEDTTQYIKNAKVFFIQVGDINFVECLVNEARKGKPFSTEVSIELLQQPFNDVLSSLPSDIQTDYIKNLKTAISTFQDICFKRMGPWFAYEAIQLYLASISKNVQEKLVIQSAQEVISQLQNHIQESFKMVEWSETEFATHGFISKKLISLLKLLTIFRHSLNCIIFVKQRIDANLIYRWLMKLSANVPEFSFINPGFICGTLKKDMLLSFDPITDNFKEKFIKKELNVMVATSVLEEGIDVPICNLVIKLDFPTSFREFIQSKGRARDPNSYYILMVDEITENLKNDLINYWKCENHIKVISDNDIEREELIEDQNGYNELIKTNTQFTTKNGTLLFEYDSAELLNYYISLLPDDGLTDKKLNFKMLSSPIDKNNPQGQQQFCYLFMFPFNCSLRGIIRGQYRSSKSGAKNSCSFEVCKTLYEQGELNDDLEVINEKDLIEMHAKDLNLTVQFEKVDLFTDPIKTDYCSNLASLKHNSENTFHLYLINFVEDLNLIQNGISIGFITKCILPFKTLKSMIYCNKDRIQFSIQLIDIHNFNETNLKLINTFHQHIVEVLLFKENLNFEQNNSFYLVPIGSNNKIDFDSIMKLIEFQSKFKNCQTYKYCTIHAEHANEKWIMENLGANSLVVPVHNNKQRLLQIQNQSKVLPSETFTVNASKEKKNAGTGTVDISYSDYYENKYSFPIKYSNLPLIKAYLVKPIFKKNFKYGITFRVPKDDKEPSTTKNCLFPPELLLKYPFPNNLIHKCNAIPAIMYRMEQFLIGHEFLVKNFCEFPNYQETIDFDSLLTANSYYNQTSKNIFRRKENSNVPMKIHCTIEDKFNSLINKENDVMLNENGCKMNPIENEINENVNQIITAMISTLSLDEDSCKKMVKFKESISKFIFKGDIKPHIKFTLDTFDYLKYPNPWYIVKAFVLEKAQDLFNLEQLETVGDAFLKMATSLHLFFRYPSYDVGKLTNLKVACISNDHLFKLGTNKRLEQFINASKLVIGENWIVPFFPMETNSNFDIQPIKLKDKNVADCVEALIGTMLIHGSARTALSFFEWIGIPYFDPNDIQYKSSKLLDPIKHCQAELEKIVNSIEISFKEDYDQIQKYFVYNIEKMVNDAYCSNQMNEIEVSIGYTFKNKYFLVQAFTHPSYRTNDDSYQNQISSYQRLEFIGDAILDYIITYAIYQHNQFYTPGEISTLRSSLVSNNFFASIMVKYNLQRFIRASNEDLKTSIDHYVELFRLQNCSQLNDNDNDNFESMKVPKAISDLFESLIGAIFLDCGFSFELVWQIVYRMIKYELDNFLENVPVHAKAWLVKRFPTEHTFTDIESEPDNKMKIELIITESGKEEKRFNVETGYHFQDEQIKEVETYINKQWNTFWSSYANDQLNRKLYILVIMGSIIQTRLAIKASHHVFTNFDLAYFLVINDVKTPGIEDNQFEFETISYINDPRYHRYFRDLHYKELQFINKKVIIPKELKILFNNIYDTKNQTYLETFYPFYVSLVLFSRIKKMEKAPHYELNKLAIVFNRAIFLVTVLPRFDEIFHFLIVECDGDLGDIWSYGQDGPIDVESFKLSLKKNERIFLLKEIVHGTLLAVLIPIIYYKFVIKVNVCQSQQMDQRYLLQRIRTLEIIIIELIGVEKPNSVICEKFAEFKLLIEKLLACDNNNQPIVDKLNRRLKNWQQQYSESIGHNRGEHQSHQSNVIDREKQRRQKIKTHYNLKPLSMDDNSFNDQLARDYTRKQLISAFNELSHIHSSSDLNGMQHLISYIGQAFDFIPPYDLDDSLQTEIFECAFKLLPNHMKQWFMIHYDPPYRLCQLFRFIRLEIEDYCSNNHFKGINGWLMDEGNIYRKPFCFQCYNYGHSSMACDKKDYIMKFFI